MEENIYYVYCYMDPRKEGIYKYGDFTFDHEPFYIGKGKGNRLYKHLRDKRGTQENNLKVTKIQKLINNNTPPIIFKYRDGMTEQEAFDLEAEIIKSVGRIVEGDGPLTNILPGGGGSEMPEDVKAKIGELVRERVISDETRAKLRAINKGRKHTEEHRAKMSKIRKGMLAGEKHPAYGKTPSAETKAKQSKSHSTYMYYMLMPNGNIEATHSIQNFVKTHKNLQSTCFIRSLNSGRLYYNDILTFRFPKSWDMQLTGMFVDSVTYSIINYCKNQMNK